MISNNGRGILPQVDGQPVLKFAAAYGFRNIQNLVQKMKRGRSSYHYVEVMACPSGELTLLYVSASIDLATVY